MENSAVTSSTFPLGGLVVGIDASRNRSGGAIVHLIGIIENFDIENGIGQVHVWAYKSLLDRLPERPWLFKHGHAALEKSLIYQLFWQARILPNELQRIGCDVIFATDASTLCNYQPLVVLSQDLLSYEPGVMENYRWGLARARLEFIKRVQNRAFKRAIGVMFLTSYARELVESSCGRLFNAALVPHGIDESFRAKEPQKKWKLHDQENPLRCVYVSNADLYKNQWNVVKAIRLLRDQGFFITLTLIGGGDGEARQLLEQTIVECDGAGWITQLDFLSHQELPLRLEQADIFVFASSCENLPITLLEGMAKGLPIACSNRGPMPEVLGEGGEYFDPLNFESIAYAIYRLIASPDRRELLAKIAQERAKSYTWKACARDTFKFIKNSYYQNSGERK